MAEEFASKADVAELKTELLERIEKVETTLLNEFRKWAVPSEHARACSRR